MQKWFGSLIVLLLWGALPAQVYNVTRYSTDDGLVQSQVMTLLQDRFGYLWLGTHRGVCKFDGRQFTVYGTEQGLGSPFLADMVEGPQDTLWMATQGGLSRWDRYRKRFHNFTTQDGLPENDLTCLLRDTQSRLWVGTQSSGLAIYQAGKIQANPIPWPDSARHRMTALVQTPNGRVWIGTLEGLYYYDPDGQAIEPYAWPSAPETRVAVLSLLLDQQEQLWVGTQQGVYRLTEEQPATYFDLIHPDIPDRKVYCMVQDQDGQLWLGTGNGLVRYQAGRFTAMNRQDRLLNYQMTAALLDREDNVWFGTDGGGVRRISEGVFRKFGMEDGLNSNLAKSFLEDEQGRIWISTKDRGINVLAQDEVVASYTIADGLGGDNIVSSFEDREGQFWFASYNGTLTRYADGRFRVFDDADGLTCDAVFCVTQGPQGQRWVGTSNGIFVMQGESFQRVWSQDNGLADNTIYSLYFDRADRLWIGSSAGLMRVAQGQVRSWIEKGNVGNNVLTILEDPRGRVWVGSSDGLTYFHENDEPTHLRISGASGANTVVGLQVEDNRWLWVATENGTYRLDLSQYQADSYARFEHYTQKDGLPSLECNANAIFEDGQGGIWVGTAEGAILRPEAAQQPEDEGYPLVYITEVSSAMDTSWQELGFQLDEFGLPQSLVLPYTSNRVEFSFIGISLRSPQQVEYKYMMEGVDERWSESKRQTSVPYLNLDPGEYTFKVTAKRESEEWDYEHVDTFSFTITPPFWQTWWFVLLILALLGGVGYIIYDNIATRRRRQREQRKLQNAAEKLQLEHQALYAMMNPHFTFNALQSIQYFIHRQDRKSANKFLSSFAKLVRKNLESTKVDFISLAEEVERLKLYMSLEKMRFPEKFDFQVRVEPGVDLSETQLPPMLLQPFVENSIKHGIMPLEEGGLITVDISQQNEEYLRILIQDNGIGLKASQIRRANRPNDHVSRGMQITKDRLALFARITGKEYSLDIFETEDEAHQTRGTTVKLVLPIREEVFM